MLEVDQQIDRYRVESVLGQGGMAIVYRVVHTQLDSYHAVKVLTISSRGITERLLQEGKVQAQLRHPNIVAVTDVLEIDGKPGLVMEYIDGPALDEWVQDRTLDLAEAERLFRGVVSGVAHAHKAGVIHRDLKPANVMLFETAEGYVPKVADFGLAKAMEAEPGMHKTRSGVTMGTPAYMAPEQIRDSKNVDARADVFSLGCILYELVCGRHAFTGPDVLSIFNAVASGEFAPPNSLNPDIPQRIQNAIYGALVVDRDRRIQSCEELLRVLDGGAFEVQSAAQTWAGELSEEQLASMASYAGSMHSVQDSRGESGPDFAPRSSQGPPDSLDGTLQPPSVPPTGKKRRGRAALLFGVGGMGLVGVAAVVLVLAVLVGGFFWTRSVGNRLDRALTRVSGGALTHQGISVRPGGITVSGVELEAGGETWFTAEALRLEGRPWAIVQPAWRADRAVFDGAVLHLRKEDEAWVLPEGLVESWTATRPRKAGGVVGQIVAPGARIEATTADGTLTTTFEELVLSDVVLGAGPSGGVWKAAGLELSQVKIADDDTHFTLEHALVSEGEADLEGLEAWVRLRTDGAVDVPVVIADGIADWAGGNVRQVVTADWQGLPLGWLPVPVSELHIKDGTVTLVDRANAVKSVSWAWTMDRANVGPASDGVLPFTVGGRVGGGRLSLEGDWKRDGLMRGTFTLRDLPVAELSPYVDQVLRDNEVEITGGVLDGTFDFGAKSATFGGVYEASVEGVTMGAVGEVPRRGKRLLDKRDETVNLGLEGDLSNRKFAPFNQVLKETADAVAAPVGGVRDWTAPETRRPAQVATRPKPKPTVSRPASVPAPETPAPEPAAAPSPDPAPDAVRRDPEAGEDSPVDAPAEDPPADEETPPEDAPDEEAPEEEEGEEVNRGEQFNKDVREALDKLRLPRIGGKRR